jgi:hypothetical protein
MLYKEAEPLPMSPKPCLLHYSLGERCDPWTNSMNIPQACIKRHPDPAPERHVNRRIHNVTIIYVWSDQGLDKSFPNEKWRV